MSRKLTDWLDAYMFYTENSEPPTLFRLWTGVSVIAAALQRKCRIELGMLTFYPNLYVVLVGPSGTRKGTAMYPGQELIRDLSIPIAADATTLQALIKRLKEANSNPHIDEETGAPILHSSLTIFSKEFTVFLGYKNDELISTLCDWYDCDSLWTYDTKTSGTFEIRGVWVNMIGATTPDLIRSAMPMDAIGGGLTSRIIFVYEQNKAKTVPLTFLTPEQLDTKQKLFLDLEKISTLSGKFKITEGFTKRWVEWYELTDASPPVFNDNKLAGYMQRRPNHIMKLSMIMSISRSSNMIMDKCDIDRAIKLLELTERKMPNVFSGVGENPIAAIIPKITMFLEAKQTVTYDELVGVFFSDMDEMSLNQLLQAMEKMGKIKMAFTGVGPKTIKWIG